MWIRVLKCIFFQLNFFGKRVEPITNVIKKERIFNDDLVLFSFQCTLILFSVSWRLRTSFHYKLDKKGNNYFRPYFTPWKVAWFSQGFSFSPQHTLLLLLLSLSLIFLLLLEGSVFSVKAWPWSYSVVFFLESLLSWTELILMHVSDWRLLVLTSVSHGLSLRLNANPRTFDLFPFQQLRSLMVTWIGFILHAIAKATSHI